MRSSICFCFAAFLFACFLQIAHASNPFPMPHCAGFKLEEATIDEIQARLKSGKLTSVQLVKCYVDRINKLNPYLKTVIEINPDLVKIASSLDKERKKGHVRGPLHGIPVLVKDNIATKDKLQTTAGSLALLGSIVPRDAFVIAKLRKAGAIILGKGNMSEWADIRASSYSEGFSARLGQTRNCFNLSQDPAGSSSGPAHAVSANMVTVAIGTETDGSVIAPSQRAGIVGIKPTVGLTSRSGVIPESHNQDTVGAFGRTFKDAAYVLSAIHGIDSRDSATKKQAGKAPKDYTKYVSTKHVLKGIRIGLPWDRVWNTPTTLSQLPQLFTALEAIKKAGAIIVNGTNLKDPEGTISPFGWDWTWQTDGSNPAGSFPNRSEFTVVSTDFYNDINKYLSELKHSKVHTLQDIINFNNRTPAENGAAFASGSDGLQKAEDTKGIMNSVYHKALDYIHRKTREEGIDYALAGKALKHPKPVDILLVPSDHFSPTTEVPAMAGYPMVTFPVARDQYGVPFGLSLWGTAFSEPKLIKYGSAIEDLLRARIPPTFHDFHAKNVPINFEYGSEAAHQFWPDLSKFHF